MIMKRKLIEQMLNEWRTNIWLVVELVIVVCVLHFLFNSLYGVYLSYDSGKGLELNDIYFANLNALDEGTDGYVPYDSLHSKRTDYELLLAKLRSNPYVEVVAGGSMNSVPYAYNYWGTALMLPSEGNKVPRRYNVNLRGMSPDMFRVFRIKGVDGQTPEELAEIISAGGLVISDYDMHIDSRKPTPEEFLGKEVYFESDSLKTYRVGAIAYGLRRSDYEPLYTAVAYQNVAFDDITSIGIRVKPGMGHQFEQSLTDSDMEAGNLYLTDLQSIEDRRYAAHIDMVQNIRNNIVFSVFVLMVIFLGFLGSFWFRTQQRVSEIAIRKVSGATNRSIYSRFFGEGLILLSISVVIALPLIYWLSHTEMLSEWVSGNLSAALVSMAWTVGILALLIVAGIYVPARKATQIEPANAIKDI